MDMDRNESQEALNLEFVKVFRRNKRLILLLTLLGGLLFAVISFLQPPMFKATAVVLPPISEELRLTSMTKSRLGGAFETTPALAALAILKSRRIKEDIVKKFGLVDIYGAKNLDEAVKILESNTSIMFLDNEGTIKVSVYDRDPRRAADIANYYIQSAEKLNEDLQVFVKRPMLKVVDPAVPPFKKAKPHRVLNTIVGLFAGFVLGIVVVFIRNIRDEKFYSFTKVSSYLKSPVIVVPEVKGIREERDIYKKLYVPEEEVLSFWTKLVGRHFGGETVFFGVTSPRQKEGKTFVSFQIANMLIGKGKRCLLVDANPLSSKICEIFSLTEDNCLDTILTGREIESIVVKPRDFPCHVASLKKPENLVDNALLDKLRKIDKPYEFIIFDLPHLFSAVPVWQILAVFDNIFVVYKFSKTSVRDIIKISNILLHTEQDNVQFILNGFDDKVHSL